MRRAQDCTKAIRPFAKSAQVSNRGCSRPLQRAVTDFGADQPFAQAMDKLVEHYGVVLGESTIARITEGHAKRILETGPPPKSWPTQEGTSTAIIVQTDGGMVPIVDIVDIDANQGDKRKGKTLRWQEAKICLAHPQGSKTLVFGGTLQGDVDTAAWWRPHNAEHMLALRFNRANRQWDSYWQPISDKQHDQITASV